MYILYMYFVVATMARQICKLSVNSLYSAQLRSMESGVSLYERFGCRTARVGNVSRSLGRNTIIASNDSIETLIDGVVRERSGAFAVSQIRCATG